MADMNYDQFKTYYYNTTKYEKKVKLLEDFRSIWWDSVSHEFNFATKAYVKRLFTPQTKKAIKIKLQGKGHTPGGIDSLYRCLTNWLNAN